MMDKRIADHLIELLKQGKDIPAEFQDVLFPVNHKEYELTYKNKTPRIAVVAGSLWRGYYQKNGISGPRSGVVDPQCV